MSSNLSIDQLAVAPLAEVASALQSGQTTSVELTRRFLASASDAQGQGSRVFTELFADQALAAARASDLLRAAGLARSPLEGIVLAVKDLFDVAGVSTKAGSFVLKNAPKAQADALIVRRLRAAGAVIIGLTNMTEFAFSGLGLNPHYGTPLNPWDRETGRIPGGSSSGSAVAVSDAMACAAIGTDTGGSVRIPAALCGLTGFKPTASRIDQTGALPLSPSLDSIGPIARSVQCCALLDAVMAGQCAPRLTSATAETVVLGMPRQLFMEAVDDDVANAFDRACGRLRDGGVQIVPIDLPELDELPHINHAGGLAAAESWAWHEELLERNAQHYDPRVAVRIRRGSTQTARDYIELTRARVNWIRRVTAKISGVDALVTPTVPRVAPALSALEIDDELYALTNMLMLRNPSVINFLDGCAISLPCHESGQAPVGLMLACASGQDARLLSVGLLCESLLKAQ
ncbi:amidase [Orrella marina]|uniref:Amidase n=1 Tax=Orrella marina TaxID=2163011 RepID=A0A2R4XHN3_9BURK|nr:amidase [Orrella marina]AWB33281.1 amidase [Orrella marina]